MTFTHPNRTVHLIDIENLLGEARPSRAGASVARAAYERQTSPGPHDLLIVACNHGAAIEVGTAFTGCRLLLRSGPDGADLALLDVVAAENVEDRFDAAVIGSGDGIFAPVAAQLSRAGVAVSVVSRPESLSRQLRLASGGRVISFPPIYDPAGPAAALVPAAVSLDKAA